MSNDRGLSQFGERQVERIAQRQASQFNESVGKYPNLRYQLALLISIANILFFMAAVTVGIFVFVDGGLLFDAVGLFVLSFLLKHLSEWLTPDAIDC